MLCVGVKCARLYKHGAEGRRQTFVEQLKTRREESRGIGLCVCRGTFDKSIIIIITSKHRFAQLD